MTEKWKTIAREAGLAAEHLGIGVTALGKANYAFPAYYSQAFFALSVGLERSCKLALAVQYALSNDGSFPTELEIRSYKHDLRKLLAACVRIRDEHQYQIPALPNTAIHNAIIAVLTSFASNVSRYYNLDIISSRRTLTPLENPVRCWQEEVVVPIVTQFCNPTQIKAVRERATGISAMLGDHSLVMHTGEEGTPIETLFDASVRTGTTRLTTPHVRVHVLQIARFVASLMTELGYRAQSMGLEDVPYLSEFYVYFTADDAYFRTRKTWSIYPKHTAN